MRRLPISTVALIAGALALCLAVPLPAQQFFPPAGGGLTVVTTLPATTTNGAQFKINGVVVQATQASPAQYCVIANGPIFPCGNFVSEILATPGESASALVDYTGNGNGSTATSGTAPTISAAGLGILCNGAGQIKFNSAMNSTAKAMSVWLTIYKVNNSSISGIYMLGGADGALTANGTTFFFSPLGAGVTNNLLGPFGDVTSGEDIRVMPIEGTFMYTIDFGAVINTYHITLANGTDIVLPRPVSDGAQAFVPPTTNFDLCGNGTGGLQQITGHIGTAVWWSVHPTASQLSAWALANAAYVPGRGGDAGVTGGNAAQTTNELGMGWDSMTDGGGGTGTNFSQFLTLDDTYNNDVVGNPGTQATNFYPPVCNLTSGMIYHTGVGKNAFSGLIGINDMTTGGLSAAAAFQNVQALHQCMQLNGWKVMAWDLADTAVSPGSSVHTSFNPLMAQGWNSYSARYVALGSTVEGISGNFTGSPNQFTPDGLHFSIWAQHNVVAPLVSDNVNALYGHTTQNSATTYTTGDSVGTDSCVPTAFSETGNVVTVTCAAETFSAGQLVTIAGANPAGYNGTFQVSPTGLSGTQFQVYNFNTGLGALVAGGTATAPFMRARDVVAILGGSAAAPTETENWCPASMGMPITRIVTNVNGWTIKPFTDGVGTPTINGATSLFIPYNSTVTLTCQNTSYSAATSIWVATVSPNSGANYSTVLTSGTSWTSPPRLQSTSQVKITMVGGGNAGGTSGAASIGLPGGSGCVIVMEGTAATLGLAANTAYTIAIGNATGGSTTFNNGSATNTAAGGSAGSTLSSAAVGNGLGGAGGACTTNIAGSTGYPGNPGGTGQVLVITTTYQTGQGGSPPLGYGIGGQAVISGVAGNAGTGFGSGGSGGGVGTQTGGAGKGGAIIIEITF